MKRLVDHKLRLGLDDATFLWVEEIYEKKKGAVPSTTKNDVLVELIRKGLLVETGRVKLDADLMSNEVEGDDNFE